ncbi:MAG: HpcH/HpaI aldolase/citrate lyase family protein [Deinococcus sp.]|nr:HpcH/HpaI aldolase/citrate lyase family protein [Deinococcus sp.]
MLRQPAPGNPALSPWAVGASMYTPATHPDLYAVGTGRYPGLTSVIFCTEDAIREEDVPQALGQLERVLPALHGQSGPLRFVRVRSPQVLRELLTYDLSSLAGLVLPKVHAGNLGEYLDILNASRWAGLSVMPTLETPEAFSAEQMTRLRGLLLAEGWDRQILTLRIGGNDLMSALGVRRRPGQTLYEGPLAATLGMLVSVFQPYGLALSSPVYEVFSDPVTLARELRQDLDFGLCGKTIVHPAQLQTVLAAFRVSASDYAEAEAILQPDAPGVFQMNGRMCEPATHRRWAANILARAQLYGLEPAPATETA